jgi:hypothetical protein
MWRHCSGVGLGCCRIGSNQDSVFGCHRPFLDVQEKLEWWESEKANFGNRRRDRGVPEGRQA